MDTAGLMRRRVVAILGASMLAGCGFRPVYGPPASGEESAAAAALAQIQVGLIPERSGQLLRLALQERFERAGPGSAHKFDLAVSFGVSSDAIAIRTDSSPTWVRMVGTATYSLVAQDPTRATVTSGTARSVDGYNLYVNQYFAASTDTDAVQRRIAQAVADQIALQLADFFAKHSVTAPAG
jgi:LPS-assembly lipoprotein